MGWTPPGLVCRHHRASWPHVVRGVSTQPRESEMNATVALRVVGVDVANTVFQLAVADSAWRVTEERCTCARLGVKRIARVLADPHSGVLEARVAQLARAWL